ncbi:hypothetical protein [Natrinema sp. DC36]|uniref:hypothetical protein n=1 Tax=Natrinema sp. DC36 TaxID=2878680 RepID=UPI001CF0178E|nr:hypothetical protein [Natrinema sp. DC36]
MTESESESDFLGARALGGGIWLWTVGVTTTLHFRPAAIPNALLEYDPLLASAVIFFTIGICGVFAEAGYMALEWLTADSERDELTEVPWE